MLGITFGTTSLEKLVSREMALTAKMRGATVAIDLARKAAGEALVEGEGSHEIATVARLSAEIDSCARAISLIRARRADAIREENRTAARKLRADAESKRRELSAIKSKVAAKLAEIGKLEGVSFDDAALAVGASGPRLTGRIEDQVTKLTVRADELESMSIGKRGTFDTAAAEVADVTDDEPVVAAVLRHRSEGPSANDVLDWLSHCATDKRLGGQGFGSHPRRIAISWDAGKIDRGASYVYVPSFTHVATMPGPNGIYRPQPGTFDIESGTFRAPKENQPEFSRFLPVASNAA